MAIKKGTVGQRLTSARLNLGLTIEDVQKKTKIQTRYLKAIEQDQFNNLPSDFYAQAFIRQYAHVVGENEEELLAIYNGKIKFADSTSKESPHHKSISKGIGSRVKQHENPMKSKMPMICLLVTTSAIILVVFWAMLSYKGVEPQASSGQKLQVDKMYDETSSEKQPTVTKKKKHSSSTSTSSSEKNDQPEIKEKSANGREISLVARNMPQNLEVEIKAVGGQTWINFTGENGTSFFSGTLANGYWRKQQLSPAVKQITITVGAPAYTEISLSGTKVDLGKYGGMSPNLHLTIEYSDKNSTETTTSTTSTTTTTSAEDNFDDEGWGVSSSSSLSSSSSSSVVDAGTATSSSSSYYYYNNYNNNNNNQYNTQSTTPTTTTTQYQYQYQYQ